MRPSPATRNDPHIACSEFLINRQLAHFARLQMAARAPIYRDGVVNIRRSGGGGAVLCSSGGGREWDAESDW